MPHRRVLLINPTGNCLCGISLGLLGNILTCLLLELLPCLSPQLPLPRSSWCGISKTQILIRSDLVPPWASPTKLITRTEKNQCMQTAFIFTFLPTTPNGFLMLLSNHTAIPECIHSLDKYRPPTPPFHCTFTQKIESNFPQGPTPTFIHLPPPVPVHSAFPPIMWIELSIFSLLSSFRTWLQRA